MEPAEDDWAWGSQEARPSGARVLLTVLPLAAIAALALLIAAVIWIARYDAEERTRTKLMSDAIWVEQALRFQLSSQEDMLQRAAFESAGATDDLAAVSARTRIHIASSPEMLQIVWFDAAGTRFHSVPDLPVANAALPLVAPGSGRPRYDVPRVSGDGHLVVDMTAPIADGSGQVVATVSVSDLIARHVPWWIAEGYAVQVVDGSGKVLAEKARVEPRDRDLMQLVSFDPPLPGLSLLVSPYRKAFELSSVLLPAAIVAAALLSAVSLVVLQRQSNNASRVEARLAGAVAFRHAMEDSLTVGLRAKDHDGRVLYVNAAFCKLVGYAAADLIGRLPPMPFWVEDIHTKVLQSHAASGQQRPAPQTLETRFRRPDGTEVDVQIYEAPLFDAQDRHRGWMGSFIDITEQKRAQDLARVHALTLHRTGRLVTMGEMASTLAHELNQPLSAIASYATGALNLLNAKRSSPEILVPALQKLSLQADRAGQIIRRVQDFTRKRDPRFRPVELRAVIVDSCNFLYADARHHGIRLLHRAEPGVAPVLADSILLEQVLTNLIRNGIEAMAANPARLSGELIVTLSAQGDGQVIEVIDNGTGIAPEIADRLFDPFTTTKPEGMGIGLNICRSIVELHRGQLRFRANPQGGTIFSVWLPTNIPTGETE
jgi:two-component system sensor histidine kinase DctS